MTVPRVPEVEALTGSELFDRVYGFLGRFVAYPSDAARVAHTLWIAHTHSMTSWESTPRIAFLSPEPASGKTRALEVTGLLVPRPVEAVNMTSAYLFRKVGEDPEGTPTVLYDEIDTVFGPKAGGNEEIRALLNAGHRRGAVAGRCVTIGKKIVPEEIPAYCAVALAGLGRGLPDTILSRSVIINMRRRAPDERVEPFRSREQEPLGNALRDELGDWASKVRSQLAAARPEMPEGVEDRDADVWEPLLAVADAAGGDWPERARVAAVALVGASKENAPSLGIQLLADLRTVFDDDVALSTGTILTRLIALEEAPWGDLGGRPLDARRLGRYLREYGIRSKTVRTGDSTAKGYTREDLHDAWSRYLPGEASRGAPDGLSTPSFQTSVTSVTSVTNGVHDARPPVSREDVEALATGDWPRLRLSETETLTGGEESWRKFLARATPERLERAFERLAARSCPGQEALL
jgi:hypothetical protein